MRIGIGILVLMAQAFSTAGEAVESPLGFPVKIADLYIAGSKVEPIPRKDQSSSLVIRILEIKGAENGFRYDMEVYGLDPGDYQLKDYLQTIDTKEPPAVKQPITITTFQPLDTLPKPSSLIPSPPSRLGGYRTIVTIIGLLWLTGLGWLILYRKPTEPSGLEQKAEPTLGEKLYPLVAKASQGDLSEHEKAKMERLIIGFWKSELPNLENVPPLKALQTLRAHPTASPLVLKLEEWIHAPNSSFSKTEISELISPYSN